MSMHYNARAFVPAASHIINDEVVASIGFVDKRPALFPFVVSVIHSLSGYRPENVFWLNSGLTFLLLGLIYTIAARTCGKPHGILAILLMTSLPLLAQNTNGGGYEIMNLCLICGVVLAGLNYMRNAGNECTPSRYAAVRFCRVFHASLHLEKVSRTLIFSPK